jgi:Sec-independent protein translocase protein TatA
MMKMLVYGLLIYFLYKVIFEIVVPVSKGVKTVRQNMEQMQRQQAEAFRQAQNRGDQTQHTNTGHTSATTSAPKKEVPVEAEYIDFEEVKKK